MDSTGGELAHAALEIDENLEKDPHNGASEDPMSAPIDVDEKPDKPSAHSTTSSSEDDQKVKRLDSRVVNVGEITDGDDAYAHLPPHERDIIKKQLDIPSVTVTYRTLFRYATRTDFIIMAISMLCALAGGSVQPLMTVSDSAPESRNYCG